MNLDLKPEQTDPLAYEIQRVREEIKKLAEANVSITLDTPRNIEQFYWNLSRIESYEREVQEMEFKQKLRSRPSPARERYLKLVWSRG